VTCSSPVEASCTRRPRSGFLPDRTIHLHPLRRCNLACAHCYSASSPTAKGMIAFSDLAPALHRLREQGYEVLSLSGGEPMLYPELNDLLIEARALGFRCVAISNGFRINKRFAKTIDLFDGLAISFDGLKDIHNRVRGNQRAFEMALSALRYLKSVGKPAAAAFTVSQESLPEVPDFVEIAAELGVRAVQLRPLVMAGRAITDYNVPALTHADRNRVWAMGQALASAYDGQMAVHTDLAHSTHIAADRAAWQDILDGTGTVLSDRVNPLVITPEGVMRPYTFDFAPKFDLGTLADLAPNRLDRVMERTDKLSALLQSALHYAEGEESFLDWFAYCRDHGNHMVA
jgi:MoaA/NifB/PqqE/SkfB family radical SAM enzyme